ncbi:MAG: reverse transcriptase domain-containing protein [Bacteroidetes bacterium]|nr:reverse transcriptase domain-containing protein [Bacteroidota bacterium]
MEKSDRGIVAKKAANKEPSAELPEPRPLPEGNPQDPTTCHAQQWGNVHHGIKRIREFVARNPEFTTLLHHINEDSLKEAYHALKRDASPGVDQVTWEAYGADLDRNLADLCTRVHCGSFRATPSRRVNIPKPDGGTRPLGIAALEDKIVQGAIVKCILEPIYENEFCGFSYGFRPGRSAHNALDALAYVIERRTVNYVVDADIQKFFDTVDQAWMLRFLEHRIADQRVLRLITKFLKAGVMESGRKARRELRKAR